MAEQYPRPMEPPASPSLSPSQLSMLASLGEERRADVGDVLYRIGDRGYPFIAILEGEVTILDASGKDIVKHGPSGFLGEMNLLSGQTVFVTATVTKPLRYIAVDREVLKPVLFEDGPFSDLLLSTFIARREALQTVQGIGMEIIGPQSSEPTMRMLDFARGNRIPFTWRDPAHDETAAGLVAGLDGQAGSSRRIENYLGFPAGISGAELTSRAVTQARKFNARTATPYRAEALEQLDGRYLVRLEGEREVVASAVLLATGPSYRRLPVDGLAEYEGISVFYAAGPPEAQLCGASRVGVVGGGNSAGQAAVWLARGGALVTLLHRRGDLRETMSDYLVRELDRYGVVVRDRGEIAALHGEDGRLEAVTLKSGERLPFSFLFLFLGASPCTEWLGDSVGRDDDGFVLTGAAADADDLLGTSLPGVFAAGDVRSGSTKRCATAVGEGAMAVQFVHAHLAPKARVG